MSEDRVKWSQLEPLPGDGSFQDSDEPAVRRGAKVHRGLLWKLAQAVVQSAFGFIQAGANAVARSVQSKLRETVSATDYSSLQAAIDAAAGKRLFVPAGTYVITAGLTSSAAVEIIMDPGAVIDATGLPTGASLGEQVALSFAGTDGTPTAITASVAAGDAQLTVASTAGLSAGDYVRVESDELYQDGVTVGEGRRGYTTRVLSVDSGTTLTLEMSAPFALDSAENAVLTPVAMLEGVVVRGGKIIGGGFGKAHNGICLDRCAGAVVDGVVIEDCEDTGVEVEYSTGCVVSCCTISNATSPSNSPGVGTDGVRGYGVVDGSSMGTTVRDNKFFNCRHSFAGGGTLSPFGAVIDGNESHGSLAAAYDCHEQCFDYKFTNNKAYGGVRGFVIRGSGTVVSNNTVRDVSSQGIQVKNFDTTTTGISGVRVVGNTISNCAASAVQVWNENAPVQDVEIIGNNIINSNLTSVGSAIALVGVVKGISVCDNAIDGVTVAGTADGNAIRLSGVNGSQSSRIRISGNRISNVARNAIDVRYADDVEVSENTCLDGSERSLFIRNCNDVRVYGGRYSTAGAATDNCGTVDVRDSTRVSIYGVAAEGEPTLAGNDAVRIVGSTGVIVNGCHLFDSGRHGVYATTSDRVIVTNTDARDVVNATKINIVGATTSVDANNIT